MWKMSHNLDDINYDISQIRKLLDNDNDCMFYFTRDLSRLLFDLHDGDEYTIDWRLNDTSVYKPCWYYQSESIIVSIIRKIRSSNICAKMLIIINKLEKLLDSSRNIRENAKYHDLYDNLPTDITFSTVTEVIDQFDEESNKFQTINKKLLNCLDNLYKYLESKINKTNEKDKLISLVHSHELRIIKLEELVESLRDELKRLNNN